MDLEHNISFLLLYHMNVYYSRPIYSWKDIEKVGQKYQVFLRIFSNELCRRRLELASADCYCFTSTYVVMSLFRRIFHLSTCSLFSVLPRLPRVYFEDCAL
jgi:hypothetical protein